MSSLHQDRLLVEGSGPVTGTARTLPTARGTSRRAVGLLEKQATSSVPTQRLGKAQRTGTSQSTTDASAAPRAKRTSDAKAAAVGGTLASRAKSATVKAATAKAATVKAATAKAATAKAATAKAATAKAATAARSAAVLAVADRTASVRSARAAAAAAGKTSARTPATAKATTSAKHAATKPAVVQPAPVKAVETKAAETKPATTKAAAAKPAASTASSAPAATKPAAPKAAATPAAPKAKAGPKHAAPGRTSRSKAAAKAAPADAPAAKPAARTRTATPTTESATGAVPTARPTPHKRTPAAGPAPEALVPALVGVTALAAAGDVRVVGEDVAADPAPAPVGRLSVLGVRRPSTLRRRPALYLTAAMVGAISLSAFTPQEPTAQATATMSQSVSVAEQLGIEADQVVVDAETTERLGELAISRNTRDAEQAAAAQVQAEADRIAAEAAAEAARPKAVLPVQGARLTSGFGARWGTLHAGIDLAAPMRTPEYAVMDGVVLEAGPASGYGLAVYIQHENGDVTVYGHMDEILVQAGQVVRAGDTIALLGNRGQSTGPHLHFEVHVGGLDGQKIDPLPWLRDKGLDI